MKNAPKKLGVIIAAIGFILIVGLGYLLLNDGSDKPKNTESSTQPATGQSTSNGKYADYSAEVVANTNGQRILFFHAPWCPQCRELDDSIKSGSIPNNVTIFKVDYDSNQKLRQQYGVTIQATLVLLNADGTEAKKYVAYDQPNLDVALENLF